MYIVFVYLDYVYSATLCLMSTNITRDLLFHLKEMLYYSLRLSYHFNTEALLFCLHVFRQAGPLQRLDYLAPRWETALSVFPKDTATRYCIESRTGFLQPFDYYSLAPLSTEPHAIELLLHAIKLLNYLHLCLKQNEM